MRIVLASASPRRKQLLMQMGLEFSIMISNKEDGNIQGLPIEEIPIKLAYNKAMDVASKIKDPAIVIGADTVMVKDEVLGKPKNGDDARRILQGLQGETHEVITGLALINTNTQEIKKCYERTLVKMAPLTMAEIDCYIRIGEPMDKAGAYGIQGLAGIFISEIKGCYYNVMGLPIHRLWMMLKEFNIPIYCKFSRDYD